MDGINGKPEFWMFVKDNEKYMVSNIGRVRSYHRQWKRWVDKESRIDSKGYVSVGIAPPNSYKSPSEHKSNSARVHRLVAEAFIPNPNNLPYVNHKDHNPMNNDASNLEWCDAKYNMQYSFVKGERISGQAKPVKLYIEGQFFSNYSSVEHCSKAISLNKKFFNLAKGKNTQLNGFFSIEELDNIPKNEPLNKKVLKEPLKKISSKPIMLGETVYYSYSEFTSSLGITHSQGRWICTNKQEYEGKPLVRLSIPEYIKKMDLVLWDT